MEKEFKIDQFQDLTENNEEIKGIAAPVSEDLASFPPISKDILRPIYFSTVLSKIDEVDESRVKSSSTSDEDDLRETIDNNTENKPAQPLHVMWKAEDEIIHFENAKQEKVKQRPKSANYVAKKSVEEHRVKRSSSGMIEKRDKTGMKGMVTCNNRNSDSESNSESSLTSILGRPKSAGFRKKRDCWHNKCSWDGFYSPSRPRSILDAGTCFSDDCCLGSKGSWIPCESNSGKNQPRKCRSNPCLTRSIQGTIPNPDFRIGRFKRSLKLLGLEVTDFGIYDRASDAGKYQRARWKAKKVESTFSTKIVKRSVSLNDLKEVVREAWLDDRLDMSHWKLLAQAAYEEWYFRKAEEAHKKLSSEKIKNKVVKEKLDLEFQSRRMKAEEQYQKWIAEKKRKLKLEKHSSKPSLTQLRVSKTREEVEVAFQRWKKEKDKQKEEKQKLEMKEKEKEINREREKETKKQLAERAFIEWKRKLEETEKNLIEAKLKKDRRKKEIERQKKEKEKKTSFQMWKDMKDRELMVKREEKRKSKHIENALRSAQLEERIYEAEQAFEEWLGKLEKRESHFKSKTVS